MKVVRKLLSACNGIRQKPEAASRDVKTVEPDSLTSVSSAVDICLFSFLAFWSPMQILTVPVGFMTGTTGAHQSVLVLSHLAPPLAAVWTLGSSVIEGLLLCVFSV